MSLGENIYKLRTEKRLSQGDLAEALEVSRQSVSKWENDAAVPELEKLINMSKLFGVTLDELVSGKVSAPRKASAPAAPSGRFSRRQIAGIVFWFLGVVILLFHVTFGLLRSGFISAAPFLICGGLCYWGKFRHPVLWCLWVFALPLIFIPFENYIRLDISTVLGLLFRATLLIVTIWCLRKDPVSFTKWTKALLITGYGLWFAYILLTVFLHIRWIFYHNFLFSMSTHLIDTAAYLLFIILLSVTVRLLKFGKLPSRQDANLPPRKRK